MGSDLDGNSSQWQEARGKSFGSVAASQALIGDLTACELLEPRNSLAPRGLWATRKTPNEAVRVLPNSVKCAATNT